ncbi:hypothetical protein [Ideonella sp. YS5]|uniref:hypothetical protein n=1 Tax=Ideonella sp. YS5 TaxID=3453714 RepID=UPI003EEDD54D
MNDEVPDDDATEADSDERDDPSEDAPPDELLSDDAPNFIRVTLQRLVDAADVAIADGALDADSDDLAGFVNALEAARAELAWSA